MSKTMLSAAIAMATVIVSPVSANTETELQALRQEIANMKNAYESKINQLENKVNTLEHHQNAVDKKFVMPLPIPQNSASTNNIAIFQNNVPATPRRMVNDTSFNPAIGVILQGQYQSFSSRNSNFGGFAVGEEAGRGTEGLGINESELNFAANVDDKFRGSSTFALVEEDGETVVEIEETYIETIGLPYGLSAKFGRFFTDIGYLNSHHSHSDDFADRPLTNRVFLNNNYGDDGVQVAYVLPTELYSEIGGGMYRGNDFPGGSASGSDVGSWTGYGRVGGDIGDKTTWRLGVSTLQSGDTRRSTNDNTVVFDGKSNLYIADTRMVYAPTGNNVNQEITLQAEYFLRDEDGTYDDTNAGTGAVAYDKAQSGFYAQTVYKFDPQWRIGTRYSQLYTADTPTNLIGSSLDSNGHNPWAVATMLDWTNSEFSRTRLQYNHEELSNNQEDNQIMLQYIVSIGAHSAHAY
jgi:hypothetical protein